MSESQPGTHVLTADELYECVRDEPYFALSVAALRDVTYGKCAPDTFRIALTDLVQNRRVVVEGRKIRRVGEQDAKHILDAAARREQRARKALRALGATRKTTGEPS